MENKRYKIIITIFVITTMVSCEDKMEEADKIGL